MPVVRSVKLGETTYNAGRLYYGTCDSVATEVNKVVTCAVFGAADLVPGAAIAVKNTTTNSGAAASLTMNVNGTGAKSIKRLNNGAIANIAANEFFASTMLFVYDGTYWLLSGSNYNTTYSNMSQAEATAGTATATRLISAKVLNDTIDAKISTAAATIPAAGASVPKMNGTGATGTATAYSREDHVHPSDTTKANLASPTFTGTPKAPTAATTTNNTQIATTAFVQGLVSGGYVAKTEKGATNGVASLGSDGKVPAAQLPSYVDDVLEYTSMSAFPATGEAGKIYIATDTNKIYRWSGTTYSIIGGDLALGETQYTAYRGDRGKAAYDHATAKGSAFGSGLYKITTNAEGHVTAAATVTKDDITALGIPASDTDTKVTQTVSTTNGDFPVLASGTTTTSTKTTTATFDTKVTVNHSTGNLKATMLNGVTIGTAPKFTDTTYSTMSGASASAAGTGGLVPTPEAGKQASFLRGDGTWAVPTDTNTDTKVTQTASTANGYYPVLAKGTTATATITDTSTFDTKVSINHNTGDLKATMLNGVTIGTAPKFTDTTYGTASTTANGLMSSEDKTKLNGIASGAEVNQNAFSNIKVGNTTVAADTKTDTVEFAGSNVTITPDATNDKVTFGITSTNVTTALGFTPANASSAVTNVAYDSTNKKITKTVNGTTTDVVTVATLQSALSLTKSDVGLGNVDNTADADKSVKSAGTLTTGRAIDGVTFNGSAAITHYGTCGTAAATAAKTVACTSYTLVTGSRIIVKFTVTNTAASPTLNVNSTGAKAIQYRGAAISAGYLAANRTYEFIYDGTNYQLVGDLDSNTTYSGLTSAIIKTGTETTNKLVSGKVISDALTENAYRLYGGTPTSNTDLNTYVTPGTYYCATGDAARTYTNNPYSAAASSSMSAFRLYVIAGTGTSANYIYQKLEECNKNDEWVRYSTNTGTNWSTWYNRSVNTDTKVTQTAVTADATTGYNLLATSATTTSTTTAVFGSKVKVYPEVGSFVAYGKAGLLAATLSAGYKIWGTSKAAAVGGLFHNEVETSTTVGTATLQLGNERTLGTEDNAKGRIILFGDGAQYHNIYANPNGTNRTNYLPPNAGTFIVRDNNVSGLTTSATSIGSTTKGVYISAGGVATAMSYSVSTDVPASAKFTDTYPSSLTWTAGTTAGPVPSIGRAGSTTSAVTGSAIPVASATASGVVTTGDQAFAGTKMLFAPVVYSSTTDMRYPSIRFRANGATGTIIGEMWYDVGATNTIKSNRISLREYSPVDSTGSSTTTSGFHETYSLPAVDVGRTTNATYNILTSKSAVTIAQGGTGATTAAAARTNLGLGTAATMASTAFKAVQTAKSDPTASGTGVAYIASISQDAQGVITATKSTVRTYVGATSTTVGTTGLVPSGPTSGYNTKFLRADGTWVVPTNTDTKAQFSPTTTGDNHPLVFLSTGTTATVTTTAQFSPKVYVNAGTGKIYSYPPSGSTVGVKAGFVWGQYSPDSSTYGDYGYTNATVGTTETQGYGVLVLGNNKETGTTHNAAGDLTLYGKGSAKAEVVFGSTGSTNRVFTLPDVASSQFVMTAGNQTIAGNKTFSAAVYFANGTTYYLGSDGGINANSVTANGYLKAGNRFIATAGTVGVGSYTNTIPTASGTTGQVMFVTV